MAELKNDHYLRAISWEEIHPVVVPLETRAPISTYDYLYYGTFYDAYTKSDYAETSNINYNIRNAYGEQLFYSLLAIEPGFKFPMFLTRSAIAKRIEAEKAGFDRHIPYHNQLIKMDESWTKRYLPVASKYLVLRQPLIDQIIIATLLEAVNSSKRSQNINDVVLDFYKNTGHNFSTILDIFSYLQAKEIIPPELTLKFDLKTINSIIDSEKQ